MTKRASKAVRPLPARAWKWSSGWLVKLSGNDGSFIKRPAKDYADACAQRREALKTGRYYQGWIEEKR